MKFEVEHSPKGRSIKPLVLVVVLVSGIALVLSVLLALVTFTTTHAFSVSNIKQSEDSPSLRFLGAPTISISPEALSSTSGASSATATCTPTEGCGVAWRIVPHPSPTVGGAQNQFLGLATVSADNLWAVGSYTDNQVAKTLIEHWDGTQWGIVPSPNVPEIDTNLVGASAVSANDIWAVGATSQTVTMHWDGSAWNIVPSPNVGIESNLLYSVTAVASGDVWAAGYYEDENGYQRTLIEHWDGAQWSIVPSPNVGAHNNVIEAMSAVAPDDVWAVGLSEEPDVTLAEHWDGTRWSVISSPNVPGSTQDILFGVSAVSTNDVWAVGFANGANMLVMHWDGTEWSLRPAPIPGDVNFLYGVSAKATNDAWAVGDYGDVNGSGHALSLHWDGISWQELPTPELGDLTQLWQVAALVGSNSNVWAVGDYQQATTFRTVIEHYSDPCLSPPPSPWPSASPSPTLAVATATTATVIPTQAGTPPTATPIIASTPTATASCTIQFTDVPQGSTFYPFVHCLACLGLINGYPDGTFKPNNDVTRGQLSKIVSNSAGFSEPQPSQMFQDVPLSSTFQVFIGRLASRGYINGYPCGGSGEPCIPPANLPYFRPNANATRGQISKIVSNAAGFSDPPAGQQFQDVSVGSTCYTYTYRLVSRGVMSGYPCGTLPAGPCIPPSNLPYFRPNNNATRGQTAKIDANTFFPDCNFP